MQVVKFNGQEYPSFQSTGFAAKYIIPFALEVCKGRGLDIGYSRPEWKLPGAFGVDMNRICLEDGSEIIVDSEATDLPNEARDNDYIFSSHCLEHLNDWVLALNHWTDCLKTGGILFLYLPDFSQHYWRPWHNRKHRHVLTPEIIKQYLVDKKYSRIFVSGVDLNNSFAVIAEK